MAEYRLQRLQIDTPPPSALSTDYIVHATLTETGGEGVHQVDFTVAPEDLSGVTICTEIRSAILPDTYDAAGDCP